MRSGRSWRASCCGRSASRRPAAEGAVKVPPPSVTSVDYNDWVRGVHFTMAADGKVQLTVPETKKEGEKREFKTYTADSLSEFIERYPELAKIHKLAEIAGPAALTKELFGIWSEQWKWLFPDGAQDEKEKTDKALGLLAGPINPALRKHLALGDKQGLLVFGVEQGSLAEKSGFEVHDILLVVDGKPVTEDGPWVATIKEALKKDVFAVEVLRRGMRQPLTVKAVESK